ncbi:hypothetical protein KARL1_252 [Acinetobacter phage KARL-1]|uniref:Uncharacterized protein n=2 Tax=Lazarusvirus TaxID=2842820 RepID=A0A385IIZ7_9CAUD|nr:hypothetical protein HYP70_gp252 [Acinetobacter phage KARL-1]AXY82871.1 hypothetical protein KARL1_252 [Acinetobacter phage KARL-1]QGT54043.1 hypothetical protein Stupor_030 [Acinetobacter phage Stupor]QKN87971.1 hypothetical protein Abraxas_032 [Acinetobacter phage Abraxas]
MKTELKGKVSDNFKKNPKATMSLAAIALAAIAATVGTLTGAVEPETAMALFSKVLSALTLGV